MGQNDKMYHMTIYLMEKLLNLGTITDFEYKKEKELLILKYSPLFE